MEADRQTRNRMLEMVPQQPPFRFIDEILELDAEHIVGAYRFRGDADFYRGHFPGLPITPGVILIETMAQTGVVAFGLYLSLLAGKVRELADAVTLFTLAENIEFKGVVLPEERVLVTGRKVYFRGGQIKVDVTMTRPSGAEVCGGLLAGMAIPRAQFARQVEREIDPLAGDGIRKETGA
jgi:3-hydroxyacyl-[acyl-carrier-protein] dehydratase